jgi:hypothetical protein
MVVLVLQQVLVAHQSLLLVVVAVVAMPLLVQVAQAVAVTEQPLVQTLLLEQLILAVAVVVVVELELKLVVQAVQE